MWWERQLPPVQAREGQRGNDTATRWAELRLIDRVVQNKTETTRGKKRGVEPRASLSQKIWSVGLVGP